MSGRPDAGRRHARSRRVPRRQRVDLIAVQRELAQERVADRGRAVGEIPQGADRGSGSSGRRCPRSRAGSRSGRRWSRRRAACARSCVPCIAGEADCARRRCRPEPVDGVSERSRSARWRCSRQPAPRPRAAVVRRRPGLGLGALRCSSAARLRVGTLRAAQRSACRVESRWCWASRPASPPERSSASSDARCSPRSSIARRRARRAAARRFQAQAGRDQEAARWPCFSHSARSATRSARVRRLARFSSTQARSLSQWRIRASWLTSTDARRRHRRR